MLEAVRHNGPLAEIHAEVGMSAGFLYREPPASIPPDPTKYDLVWGGPYPCLRIVQGKTESKSFQCAGMMMPGKRCFRYDGELWRRFVCSKCGRAATDLKVELPRQGSNLRPAG